MPRAKSEPVDKEIGRLIREHRRRLDLNQHDVAAPLNVTAQQIGKYERGEDQIKAGLLIELATLFGVEITALVPATAGPASAAGFAEEPAPAYIAPPPPRGVLAECRDDILAALDRAEARLAKGER